MIIGITGTIAAGKGTIVKHLESLGFKHYSVRNFLIKIIKKRKIKINRDSMVAIANELREKYSSGYIIEKLYDKSKKFNGDVIIESIRTIGEVEFLRKKENFYLFSIDSNQKLRYYRAISRASETDKIDFKTFKSNEKREFENIDVTKANIKKCIELSDFKFINNKNLEELYRKIDLIIKSIKLKKI